MAEVAYIHALSPETCVEEGHVDGCPGAAGGDHMYPARAPRIHWCWYCRRAVRTEDDEARWVVVVNGDGTSREELVCGRCWEKSDPPVPLDYTEEE